MNPSIETRISEINAAMAAVNSEVTRLHSDGVHLPVLRRRLDEAGRCIQDLECEVRGIFEGMSVTETPDPLDDAPLSPEAAAKIEFDAGREVALRGDTLLDLASEAAKAGFASVMAANGESRPEPSSY